MPRVLPTQAKMPPLCQPLTVAISAAHSATGKNQKTPPRIKKKIRCMPEDAKFGYAYTVMTIEAVIAKKPKKPRVFAADAAGEAEVYCVAVVAAGCTLDADVS